MKKNENTVVSFWQKNKDAIQDLYAGRQQQSYSRDEISKIINGLFCAGPAYYYIVDFATGTIEFISDSVKDILGLDPAAVGFDDIVGRVHPDDLPFIRIAEEYHLKKINELGAQVAFQTRLSYCFRELTAAGHYELFQLHALSLGIDHENQIHRLLNVHTNISHLTSVNNYKLTLMGLNDPGLYLQFDLKTQIESTRQEPHFTIREREIVQLIAAGMETNEIAEKLFLSVHTIQTHRKKMMQKAKAKNTIQLINACIRRGIL